MIRIGIFVVGALREYELCHKTWQFGQLGLNADWHLMTWQSITDAHSSERHPPDLSQVWNGSIEYKSIVLSNDVDVPPLAHAPFFWHRIYELYAEAYDLFIIMRPDLFLWPKTTVPERCLRLSPNIKVLEHGPMFVQDQMFVVNRTTLWFLSDFYRQRGPKLESHNFHIQLADHLRPCGIDPVLGEMWHHFIARPNSRHLASLPTDFTVASEANRLTAAWWNGKFPDNPYEGRLLGSQVESWD